MRKLYIAIPYSKIDKELSFQVANSVTAYFVNKGFNVFSPISHSHIIAKDHSLPDDAEFWKESNHEFIDWCDEIVVVKLAGWEDSTGLLDEMEYAISKGKIIVKVDPWSIIEEFNRFHVVG